MSFTLDYGEPVADTVERLRKWHMETDDFLAEAERLAKEGEVNASISLLAALRPLVLREAVEEEAKVMREIMRKHRSRADAPIEVMREHRPIVEFLRHQLPALSTIPTNEARLRIIRFVEFVRKHHEKEQSTAFALCGTN